MKTTVPLAAAQGPAQAFLGTEVGCARAPLGKASQWQGLEARGHSSPRPLPAPTSAFISKHGSKTLLLAAPCVPGASLQAEPPGSSIAALSQSPAPAARERWHSWESQNDV